MTISNTTRTAGPFIGNGVTAAFPFAYKVFARSDVLVARTVTATGVETILTLDSDYTVSLNRDQNASPGGVITMTVPPPVGTTLAATSNISISQNLDLTNGGGFYPAVINDAFDRIVITIQQLAAKIGAGSLNVGAAASIAQVLGFISDLAAATGAARIGGGSQSVASPEQLRTLSKLSPSKFASVSGYGDFYFDATDTVSADNGMSVIVAADGGRWKLTTGNPGPVLSATEGVPFVNGYRSMYSANLDVPLQNPGNVRFWTGNYTLRVPAGANIPEGDVRHDHVAFNGRAYTSALNSRIWGGCFLAQNDSPATNNAQVGQCYGLEVDVNNFTGYDVANLNGDGDIGGIVVASGSNSIPKFGYMLTKGGSAKGFFAGLYMREHCIAPGGFAIYFGNIEPNSGMYFGQDFAGGSALSAKTGLPIELRTSSGPTARILTNADQLQFNCGNGGYTFVNGDNNTVMAMLSNGGNFAVGDVAGLERLKSKAANVASSRALMLLNGDASIVAYTAQGNRAMAGGENGADTALYVRKDGTTNRSINAGGTVNAGGADYAEYMTLAPGCGVVQKGQIIGINADGKVTDLWADAISFMVKSTDPSYVGGDTWADAVGERPGAPIFTAPAYAGVQEPGAGPVPAGWKKGQDAEGKLIAVPPSAEEMAAYDAALIAHQQHVATYQADQQQHDADVAAARAAFEAGPYEAYLQQTAEFETALEVARRTVDRIAFAGQVPVNLQGAMPGQFILPVQDGDGIAGIAKHEGDLTLTEYMRAVGKVIAIEQDGRARIIVKAA
jgi:hypothetical protein